MSSRTLSDVIVSIHAPREGSDIPMLDDQPIAP